MKIVSALALLVSLLAATSARAAEDPAKLAARIANDLQARRALSIPRTHTTDFGSEAIGCITLARWELNDFGYRGHAFFCEEGTTGEVLGATLNRYGEVRCHITGSYVGDGCYDFSICGNAETACVR